MGRATLTIPIIISRPKLCCQQVLVHQVSAAHPIADPLGASAGAELVENRRAETAERRSTEHAVMGRNRMAGES